jgi:hypothetical protein
VAASRAVAARTAKRRVGKAGAATGEVAGDDGGHEAVGVASELMARPIEAA